jgi:hypothetical protein
VNSAQGKVTNFYSYLFAFTLGEFFPRCVQRNTVKTIDADREGGSTLKYNLFIGCEGRHAVTQLVEALRHKPQDRGFDSRWFHRNFSLT